MTDLSTAPASNTDQPDDHDAAADVTDAGDSRATAPAGPPDTASSVLQRLEQTGWRSLHGRTAPGKKVIDHIAIGPGGIFVIDSHVLDATGTDGILASVPEAAISAANQLADAIRQIVPPLTRQYVVPVLAYVASAPMSIARGPVQVCTTSMLQRVIESRTAALSSREAEEVVAVLTAAFDGHGPVAPPAPETAARESHRLAPKRRKLGWRGPQHSDDTPDVDDVAAPTLGSWPAVTPPPVWEPTGGFAPVVPSEPYVGRQPADEESTIDEGQALDEPPAFDAVEPVAETDLTGESEPLAEPGAVAGLEPLELDPATIAAVPSDSLPQDWTDDAVHDIGDPAIDEIDALAWPGTPNSPVEVELGEQWDYEPTGDGSHLSDDFEDQPQIVETADVQASPDVLAPEPAADGDADLVIESAPEITSPESADEADVLTTSALLDTRPAESVVALDDHLDELDHADELVDSDESDLTLPPGEDEIPEPDEAEDDEPRDPLIGSFPIGWPDADVAIRADDEQTPSLRVDPVEAPSTSPWPTIQLPDLAADEPELDLESLAIQDEDAADLDIETDQDAAAAPVIEADLPELTARHAEPIVETLVPTTAVATGPASAPTPIGRTQPGGRRRAPTAPWHERLLPRTRTKSDRPEGGRRAAPRPEAAVASLESATLATGDQTAPRRAGSRRSTTARPRTLSARIGTITRDKDAGKRVATRRPKPSRGRGKDSDAPFAAGDPPASLSSRGQKMYAAMSARQAAGVDASSTDDEPTNVGAPVRRLVAVGIAAGVLIASGTHVTSISGWVADHVHLPGVGDTTGDHKGGNDKSPGRSANLESPQSDDKGDGGKHAKP
jgi:hypothetical protein